MPAYPKQAQTVKSEVSRKVCSECNKNREIRFFSSKLARVCGDCKRRKWNQKLRNSPGKVNKRKDTVWAKQVKERDGFKCVVCGSTNNLNSHHIFSRKHQGLRHDLDNGITLCATHHNFDLTLSAHKAPAEFIEFIKERNGIEWYETLRKKAKSITKGAI